MGRFRVEIGGFRDQGVEMGIGLEWKPLKNTQRVEKAQSEQYSQCD